MMADDSMEYREELEVMSERIYWRNRRFGTVEQASDHREGVVEWFDANVRWQRVHVLTDDELAAKKAEWQAEGAVSALRQAADLAEPFSGAALPSSPSRPMFAAWLRDRADRIEKGFQR